MCELSPRLRRAEPPAMSLAAWAAELSAVAAPAPSEKSWTRYLTERKSVVRMAAPYSLRRRTSSPRLHRAAIQWHRVLGATVLPPRHDGQITEIASSPAGEDI